MSNVLIGIVGVILFIGLALAGALYLGDNFREARNDAAAAEMINAGTQVTNAFEMYQSINSGLPDMTDKVAAMNSLVSAGYLKSIPVGPGGVPWYIDDSGEVRLPIGTGGDSANICTAARRRAGIANPASPLACTDVALLPNDPCCTTP